MLELTLRIAFSLLVVLGLLWGLAKLARRPLAGRGGGTVQVLARQQLSRGSSVAVVRVADRALILGVSDAGVSLLGDADLDLFEERRPQQAERRTPIPLPDQDGIPARRLAGSILSPATWSQAFAFFKSRAGGKS
jgi:flagellar protein FliO/FliZ